MSYGGGRSYSGYDEYEGIFGPLGSSSSQAPARAIASSYARSNTRARAFPGKRLPSASVSANGFERRQRYLTERKSKRRVKPLDIDNKDDGENAPSIVAAKQPQQIWLPTKNFTFRQRAGKLDTRTIARLDLQKIVATTDVATIQRHLENLAFSDVTLEDVQHYSDAYFLKLFQIAQLTVEYLLNVQDSLASHCENLETQCEGLADECSSLDQENQKIENEVLALKKEIRQKQNTLATFEVMLLNATASKRASTKPIDQENDPVGANMLGPTANGQEEQGAVPLVSTCVLCGKTFVSPEYLVKHQQKKHGDVETTRSKKKKNHRQATSDSDNSSSSSGSDRKKRRREPKTISLPAEVTQAIAQTNALTKQLMELQCQLKSEKDKRAEEAKHHEQQQAVLATQLTSYMTKLQDTLVEMERKQEQSKHEVMRYTQDTLERIKNEQAESRKPQSRAGRIESDEEEDKIKTRKRATDDASKVDQRLLDSLLRTQAEIQSKNVELEQANRKLQSRLKRHVRGDPPVSSLMAMAALDAQRFGVDVGILPETRASTVPAVQKPAVEDKPVQTDEERETLSRKQTTTTLSQSIQTDEQPVLVVVPPVSEPKPQPTTQPPPPRIKKPEPHDVKLPEPKAAPPKPALKLVVEEAKPPVETPAEPKPVVAPALKNEKKPESKLQHAAHVVGKVALGFLARKTLHNPSNWLLTLTASSLSHALSGDELDAHRDTSGRLQNVIVEIEDGMTAKELRVVLAEALGDHVDYHRVLLHHRSTGRELVGNQHVAHLRSAIDVEIIPAFEEAESHVDSVLDFHDQVATQVQRIRRDSLDFAPGKLPFEVQSDTASVARAVVKLQAIARRFLATRHVEMLNIDRVVAARLLAMDQEVTKRVVPRQERRRTRSASVAAIRAQTADDKVVNKKAEEVHARLADRVQSVTGVDSRTRSAKWSKGQLSTEDYERHVEGLRQRQRELPPSVQDRIASISARLEQLVVEEYDPAVVKKQEAEYIAANRIQLALHVAVAKKKLRTLLGQSTPNENTVKRTEVEKDAESRGDSRNESKGDKGEEEDNGAVLSLPPPTKEEEAKEDVEEEELDADEIKRLADDYERSAEAKSISPSKAPVQDLQPKQREPPSVARPGTPQPGREDSAGRSPRPKDESHLISPFSKTPLLSRRSAAATITRRGSGFDNAR